MEVEITVYSHGLAVRVHTLRAKSALLTYSLKVSEWGYVKEPPRWKPVKKIIRVFMGANKERNLFWVSRIQLDDLLLHLGYKAIYRDKIKITEHKQYEPVVIEFPRNDIKPPRDYQEPIISYVTSPGELKITNLQTGKGKSLIGCEATSRLGVRTVVQTKGGYIDKLVPDFEELFDFKKGDILVVKGAKHLIGLINMAKSGDLKAKVIFISNRTMYDFLKDYDINGEDNSYGATPYMFYETLGVGFKVIDEIHEDFHLNFRTLVYMNVPKILALSATLETDDNFLKEIYEISIPRKLWFNGVDYDAYVETIALMYKTASDDIVTQENGSINYSHSAYEQWIMADKTRLRNYLDMITWCIETYHFTDDDSLKTKFVVFCRLIEFCEIVTNHLRDVYRGERINSFVSGTPEMTLKESDGIITTIESCGTAKDIPNLKTGILTRNLNRREKNEQVKGRLRRLRDFPHITPVFIYFNNVKVPKHMEYHENKISQFKGKVLTHYDVNYNAEI